MYKITWTQSNGRRRERLCSNERAAIGTAQSLSETYPGSLVQVWQGCTLLGEYCWGIEIVSA